MNSCVLHKIKGFYGVLRHFTQRNQDRSGLRKTWRGSLFRRHAATKEHRKTTLFRLFFAVFSAKIFSLDPSKNTQITQKPLNAQGVIVIRAQLSVDLAMR